MILFYGIANLLLLNIYSLEFGLFETGPEHISEIANRISWFGINHLICERARFWDTFLGVNMIWNCLEKAFSNILKTDERKKLAWGAKEKEIS